MVKIFKTTIFMASVVVSQNIKYNENRVCRKKSTLNKKFNLDKVKQNKIIL